MNREAARAKLLPVLAEIINRGDGTWIMRPHFPATVETWLTINQTANILQIAPRGVYPYLGRFLVYYRPTPSKKLVSLQSAIDFKNATHDPEFWQSKTLQNRLSKAVCKAMEALLQNAKPSPILPPQNRDTLQSFPSQTVPNLQFNSQNSRS